MTLSLLPMPGKVPLYLEVQGARAPEPGPTYAALLEADGRSVIVAPACADITETVRAAASSRRPAVLRRHAVHRR